MPITLTSIIRWIEIFVAVSCLVQTLELLHVRASFSEKGIWKWTTLVQEFKGVPLPAGTLNFLLAYKPFILILMIRLFSSLLLLYVSHPALVIILLVSTFLISLRWRGTFNGGSDYMTFLVLSMLTLMELFKDSKFIVSGAIWYLGIQTCLSYFVSGWIKLKNKNWRNGSALPLILTQSNYDVPHFAQRLSENKLVAFSASWLVILFEFSFLLSLLNPWLCLIYLGAAFLFHLVNCYVFGLNRFLFAWLAAYPAVYFCSLQIF